MLVLKRRDGQWTEVTHAASGDTMRFKIYDFRLVSMGKPHAEVAFDDDARNFLIRRPEAVADVIPS